MTDIDTDTTKLDHVTEGSGPPLVLLHPIGLDLTIWEDLSRRLRTDFTVIRVSALGHGRSADAKADATLRDFAHETAVLLRRLGLGPYHLLGASFGGGITLTLALAHPDLVRTVMLIGSAASVPEQARAILRGRGEAAAGGMTAIADETMSRWFSASFLAAGKAAPVHDRLLRNRPSNWNASWRALADLDLGDALPGIDVPVLVGTGSEDVSAPPSVARAIAEAIGGAAYFEVAGGMHLWFVEDPDRLAREVRQFLAAH